MFNKKMSKEERIRKQIENLNGQIDTLNKISDPLTYSFAGDYYEARLRRQQKEFKKIK